MAPGEDMMAGVRTHLALLRGINVGGRNRVSMVELQDLVASMGYTDAQTYIQSGNVLFTAPDPAADTGAMADGLADAICDRLAVRAPVVVVSRDQLFEVVRDNPFPEEPDPKALHAVFLRDRVDADGVAAVAAAVRRARDLGSDDEAMVRGRAVYLRTTDGYARSALVVELGRGGERRTPVAAGTARNWATVTKLAGLLDR
jgi:uncharacterized protein (DUF1697 family)